MLIRFAPLLVMTLALTAVSVRAADTGGAVKGSCLMPFPALKVADHSADSAFAGTFSCTEFRGERVTFAAVKEACAGTPSTAACPSAHVILTCTKPGKGGPIVVRYYEAAGDAPLAKRFNVRVQAKGCPSTWAAETR